MDSLPELDRRAVPFVVDLTITRQAFERRIMNEAEEIGAAFDLQGKLVVRPRRGSADEVEFFDHETPALIGSIVVHNHPLGGAPSSYDGAFAAERNLAELRIILRDGVVHSLSRPDAGWPSPNSMEEAMEKSTAFVREERRLRVVQRLPPLRDVELHKVLEERRRIDLAAIGVQMKRGSVWD